MASELKNLPEDFVEYQLSLHSSDNSDYAADYYAASSMDMEGSVNDAVQKCKTNFIRVAERLRNDCFVLIEKFINDHIWQKDPFNLEIEQGLIEKVHMNCKEHNREFAGRMMLLVGKTYFGDNIEDEWLIVFLLQYLTENIKGLIARVSDNDGEFLLIEAAANLPTWITPEISSDRVYIYEGNFHIMDTSITDLSIFNIHALFQCDSKKYLASNAIQNDIKVRTLKFPGYLKEMNHRCRAYIPKELFYILNNDKQLISDIVTAFYLRDPFDLHACVQMKRFPASTRVFGNVKMTRCLYAQLMQQPFRPDRRSSYILPSSSDPLFSAHDIGIKIAHGAEILVSRCKSVTSRRPQTFGTQWEHSATQWDRYLMAIKSKGYFHEEIAGSSAYKKLYRQAEQYFHKHVVCNPHAECDSSEKIASLLATYDEASFTLEEADEPSDDDSWLDMTPESLEKLLEERYKKVFENIKVVDQVKKFVDSSSGLDGVDLPPLETQQYQDSKPVDFDPDQFMKHFENLLNEPVENCDDSFYSEDYAELDSDDTDISDELTGDEIPDAAQQSLSFKEFTKKMDKELEKTCLAESFMRKENKSGKTSSTLDVDGNLMQSFLSSLKEQQGLPGPASNLLGEMGFDLSSPCNK